MLRRFFPIFPGGNKKYTVVFGDSTATASEAAQEARLAIQNAANVGYKPVSIGGGSGSRAFTVYVLLEGPATAPDILPTGIPVP